MGKFNELYDLLKEENENKKQSSGDKKKNSFPFSKSKLAQMTQALLNDSDYEAEIVKFKNDEFVTETIKPVRDFREQMLGKVLADHGIDKQQVQASVENYAYSLRQAETLYPLMAETVEQWMRLGHAFRFNDKKDFSGSILLRDMPGGDKTYRDPSKGTEVRTRIDPHKVIVKKGGAPKICKHKLG